MARHSPAKPRRHAATLSRLKRRNLHAGAPPGTLANTAPDEGQAAQPVQIRVCDFGPDTVRERAVEVAEIAGLECPGPVTWIHTSGVHDAAALAAIGKRFGVHPLVLEDITHTDQRPKLEDYDGALYLVLRALTWDHERGAEDEQVSIVFRPGLVLTFDERSPDPFEAIRDRIRGGKGIVRKLGADYLVYTFVDVLIDKYFLVLERVGEHLESLERQVLDNPDAMTTGAVNAVRRDLLNLRRAVWPAREAISALQRQAKEIIQPATLPYLRDAYDHLVQVIETVEIYRDMAGHLLDIYLSSLSHRMNEAMRVLTVIATIFIPLTFISGVYGMNFKYMPELDSPWGYPGALALMALVAGGLLVYFRRRRWI